MYTFKIIHFKWKISLLFVSLQICIKWFILTSSNQLFIFHSITHPLLNQPHELYYFLQYFYLMETWGKFHVQMYSTFWSKLPFVYSSYFCFLLALIESSWGIWSNRFHIPHCCQWVCSVCPECNFTRLSPRARGKTVISFMSIGWWHKYTWCKI